MTFLFGPVDRACETYPAPTAIAATTATLAAAYGLSVFVPPLIPVIVGGSTIQGLTVAQLAILTHQGVSWVPIAGTALSSLTLLGGSAVTGVALRRLWRGPLESDLPSFMPSSNPPTPTPTRLGEGASGDVRLTDLSPATLVSRESPTTLLTRSQERYTPPSPFREEPEEEELFEDEGVYTGGSSSSDGDLLASIEEQMKEYEATNSTGNGEYHRLKEAFELLSPGSAKFRTRASKAKGRGRLPSNGATRKPYSRNGQSSSRRTRHPEA